MARPGDGKKGCARIGHWVLVLVLAALAPLGAWSQASVRDWTERAANALAAGDYQASLDIARGALEVDGDNSDLHYIVGLSSYALSAELRPALAEVEAALESDRFARFHRDEALVFESKLLIRLRRWNDALSALDAVRDAVDPAATLERTKALLALGQVPEALGLFEKARAAWPDNADFARLFLLNHDRIPPSTRARRLADAFVARATDGSFDRPDLTALAIAFMPSQLDRKRTLEALRAAKGPVASIEALQYGLIGGVAAVDEYFSANKDRLERKGLAKLASLLDAEGRQSLNSHLASFTGSVEEDADGDGVVEASSKYKDGQIVGWSLDADQDGLSELKVDFAYGLPASAEWKPEFGDFTFTWGSWPSLLGARENPPATDEGPLLSTAPDGAGLASGAEASNGDKPERPLREWKLADGALSWPALSLKAFPSPTSTFYLVDRGSSPPPSGRSLALAATKIILHRKDGDLSIDMEGGIALQGELSSSGKILARISYEKGRPVSESLDQDGDGRFESRLRLDPASDPSDPLVLSYESDVDGDGIYEFKEELVPPYRKTWDLGGIQAPGSGN